MAESDLSIESLRDRLTDTLAEWGAQFSVILSELDQKRAMVVKLQEKTGVQNHKVSDLEQQLRSQSELVCNLQEEIEEADTRRKEGDQEIERLGAELESKQDLVRALRRDSDRSEQLKGELKLRDKEIIDLKAQNLAAQDDADRVARDLENLEESAQDEGATASEVEALHAELDARKTLISSLRSDIDRLSSLEEKLAEKRRVISKLENSVDRHANTVKDLRGTIDRLKSQNSRKASGSGPSVAPALPKLSDTDVQRALEDSVERTVAIDMRASLVQAQRASVEDSNS